MQEDFALGGADEASEQRLPPAAFRSLAFAAIEDDVIWTRDWICVGCQDDVPAAGDLLPYTVGTHGIHLQRATNGVLIGRFNKAQHGGCRVVPLQCQGGTKTRCSFTSCGYSRDRRAIAAGEFGDDTPAMHQYLGLRPDRLLPVRVEARGPLLFANLDSAPLALEHVFPATGAAAEFLRRPDLRREREVWLDHACNWKIAGQVLVGGPIVAAGDERPWIAARTTLQGGEAAHVLWLFPNLVLFAAEDHGCAVILQPAALGETLHRLNIFATGAARRAPDALLALWREHVAARAAIGEAMQRDLARSDAIGSASPVQSHALDGWIERLVACRRQREAAVAPGTMRK